MNPKIALLTCLAVLLGHILTIYLYPAPELKIKGVAWCYEGDYRTINDAPPLLHKLIDVHGKGVTVYVSCPQV